MPRPLVRRSGGGASVRRLLNYQRGRTRRFASPGRALVRHGVAVAAAEYVVVGSVQRVEAWSTIRLPFEPKGWLLDYRNELRTALRAMRTAQASVLLAEYATPDVEFADLENVLLYNVGSGAYSHLTRRGLICRRVRSWDGLHRVRYTLTERTDWPEFTGPLLATARLAQTIRRQTALAWWSAFRQSLRVQASSPYSGQFAVTVDFGLGWHGGDLSSKLKALLDGLVSALHVHDGSNREHVTKALEAAGDGDRLWSMLNCPALAILGQRRLVRAHGPGIAWNPADELCASFRLFPGHHPEALAVNVRAIEPANVTSTDTPRRMGDSRGKWV